MKTRKNKNYCNYRKRINSLKIKEMVRKKIVKQNTKYTKANDKLCRQTYLNPGCKGTFLEPGKKFSKQYLKTVKKSRLAGLIKSRKGIFGKKTDVLINGFYEKLPKKFIKDLKKHGATSGCTTF